jgi:hypothetical protein
MKKFLLLAQFFLLSTAAFAQPVTEAPGPSTRRSPITFSEIMYKPAKRLDARNLEFVELYNSNPWPEDISGFRLGGQIDFTFPAATAIAAQSYIIVAAVPADLTAVYGLATVYGPYTNSLKTSGALKLYDEQNSLLLNVDYDNMAPWPMGADGTAHSIVLARASYGEGDPRAWERSELPGGSPGAAEVLQTNALRSVVLNEILAHTDPPQLDSVELYNHSTNAVNLSGCTLSDDPATNRFTIPNGTTIPARGYVYFTQMQLGYRLNALGETIYFKGTNGAVLDALKFGAQENGVSYGRYPNGAAEWTRLRTNTFGTSNTAPLVSAIGYNEIMYHPLVGGDDAQYVELFNRGTNAINLGGWKLGGGIGWTFASNQVVAAGGFLVIGRNTTYLFTNYAQLNAANTVGNFSGKLSGSGEQLTLTMPDTTLSTNGSGKVTTNYLDIVVDEVTYGTGGRWGHWSDGGGSSLELMDARADKRRASNWADSDETAKAPWTTIQTTGVLDNGSGAFSPVQLGLLDDGECLVDDVEVINSSGVKCVGNGGFELGTNGLAFVGSHARSSLEAGSGFGGSVALHVRASDAISTGPNNILITLTNTSISAGQTATLRYKARWLRGSPEPLLRFWGCYLEATGRLPLPANLGTPGLANSRAKTNAGPAIYQVRHDPAVPKTNQPVVVTARIANPNPLTSVMVQYRFDPTTTTTNVAMNDAGVNGDAVANDGIYSAALPARATNAIAFIVLAADTLSTNRFPELLADNGPARECVVFFGEPNPTNLFGTYHLWLTQTNVTHWKTLPIMSNEEIDGTLVYNNRIIYNMGGRYSGSPWHQNYEGPAGNKACHYVWSMPEDDQLLGYKSFNKIHWPGNDIQNDTITTMINDTSLQREQAANKFFRALGAPWMNRRFVAVYVNGTRRGKLMEDACRPTASNVNDEYFGGDTDGQLYKIQRWYDGSSTSLIGECSLVNYTTTGGAMKTARYRPIWGLKATSGSMSDYTNVFALNSAANAYGQANYENLVENLVDAENWMRHSAANHAAGNWDCFGVSDGQNADAWVSANQRWKLFTIDLGICLDNNLSGVSLFAFGDNAWSQMFARPKFARMYYRALNELVNGVMQAGVINPMLEAKYAAFTAAGLAASSPANTKSWIASQRSSIVAALAGVNSAVFTPSSSAFVTSTNSVLLTGSAPVEVTTIRVNGIAYTPNWTSLTNWSLSVPVAAGVFNWSLVAYDRYGNTVGANFTVMVQNNGTPDAPTENVRFNEILFNPARPGGEFIELFNRSSTTPFDISGWTVNGISYTFPPGSTIPPQSYLVLAKSRVIFAATYGGLVPVFDTFTGSLQTDGETLSLLQPASAFSAEVVVDRVRYETKAPWPSAPATQTGVSLQLVDAAQDNSRAANWNSSLVTKSTPGLPNSVANTLPTFPMLWLNEVQAANLTGPVDNFGEPEPWAELYNAGTNAISLTGFFLGTNYDSSATNWAFPPGTSIAPGQFRVVWLDGQSAQTSGTNLHTGFRLDATGGKLALARMVNSAPQIVDYLNYSPLTANFSYGDFPDGQPFYRQSMFYVSPGGTNNALAAPITVCVNEWMAENTAWLINPSTGKYDDWFELYNPSGTPADLTGYYLTDDLNNRFQFQIPAGFIVPTNGYLLVWADDKVSANTNSPNLHVPFKLSKSGEAIGLFAPDGTAIDAIEFGAQTSNVTEGRYPDGGAVRLFLPTPSPKAPNILPPASNIPTVTAFSLLGTETLNLTFQTSPGHTYRVEYKNDLSDSAWVPLGADYLAPTNTATISDAVGGDQRFYRVNMIQ